MKGVEDTSWQINEETGYNVKLISYYIPEKNIIKMDESENDNSYKITFRHEYGHYIDDIIGNYSENNAYNHSFQMDKKNFDNSNEKGVENLNALLHDLIENTSAFKSIYVSDILSALTLNNTKVIEFYGENSESFYGHENEYWFEKNNADKKETYANMFAIYSENNKDVVSFVEKWFSNIATEFKNSLNVKRKELIKV